MEGATPVRESGFSIVWRKLSQHLLLQTCVLAFRCVHLVRELLVSADEVGLKKGQVSCTGH
jgi:hypothetical protein